MYTGGNVKSTTMAGDTSLYLAAFAVINYTQSDYSILEDIIMAGKYMTLVELKYHGRYKFPRNVLLYRCIVVNVTLTFDA